VALQGTLDTFALPDVLRLLATTQKTGRLRLTGSRGTGSISVDGGTIGAIEASAAPLAVAPVDALFELLRFEQGSFTFDADSEPATSNGAGVADLESLLAEAEALLVEWREIELVVPSMEAWITLRPSLAAAKVSLDRDLWAAVVTIGGGATMRQIAESMALPELPASRAMRALVDLGLAEVAPEEPQGAAAVRAQRRAEPLVASAEPVSFVSAFPGLDGSRPPAHRAPAHADPNLRADELLHVEEHPHVEHLRAEEHTQVEEQSPEDEVVRQLARLSPRAAEAVRNAVTKPGDETAQAASTDEGEGDERINRGLLLKFLSSVKD